MTTTSGMPAAPAATPRTMAGDMRARPADRAGKEQAPDAGFDAALRARDQHPGGRQPVALRPADAETSPRAERQPVDDLLDLSMPEEAPQEQGGEDTSATEAQATPAMPVMMLATGQPGLQPTLPAQVRAKAAGEGVNGPKKSLEPHLTDGPDGTDGNEDVADMPEGGITIRRLPADAPVDTRMSFRIQVQSWHQSRHFAAPASASAPTAEATPQSVAVDAARHRAAADMPVSLPQMPMSSAMADAPLPAGDTEALAGRIIDLARELSPPAVTTRQLDIAIAPPQGGTLTVRLALRGDELQVTLRVPDAAMADRLKQEADHLARRLGQAEVHGATRVQVNVIVDPNAVTPAARSEAAHGFMQPPAHQQPMPQGHGQQSQMQNPMAGQGMGGHPGGGPGQGSAMHQGASPHRHAPLMDEGANGNGSEARHDPLAERQAPAGHRRLYI